MKTALLLLLGLLLPSWAGASTFVNGTGTNALVYVEGVPCLLPPGVWSCGHSLIWDCTGSNLVSVSGVLVVGAGGEVVTAEPTNQVIAGFGAALLAGSVVRIWRQFAWTRPQTIDPL